ncbi:MAG: peptidylprolyl isomerase, partial [Thermodesulfovibrionales bacterium]
MFKSYSVGAMIIACILLFSGFTQANVLLDRVVAVVNQDVITWSELYKAMEADASPKMKALQKDEQRKVFKENEALFLETLINVRLQLQEAKSAGIRVSDEELQGAIDNIKKKYSMSDAAFSESLKQEGLTFAEYKKRLWEQIVISKLVNSQIRNKIVVTDEDLKKFVAENKEALGSAESYRISQIFLKKQKDADNSKLEEKAADLLKKIEQGESFSDLAKQYSEDPSAKAGGDLGLLKKSQLNKNFIDIISQMKPGDISKPFWTDNGLHIIKLESSTEVKNKGESLEEARERLNNKLFREKYNAWIKSLREKSFIEVR